MAITKETQIAKIEVVGEYKAVQIATDTVIKEDGVELSRSRHRKVVHPDQDISVKMQRYRQYVMLFGQTM
jgi:hypothetical protein